MSVPELLVLAGGFGTRLRSVVADVPKPLAPVAGRPFLHYLLDAWVMQGVRRCTFLLHHQAAMMQDSLAAAQAQGEWSDCDIATLVEPEPLGTGGAVSYAVQELGLEAEFLVANADTWLGSGIRDMAASSAPTIAIVAVADAGRYGNVRTDAQDRHVVAFAEKVASGGRGRINAGLYKLHCDCLGSWDGRPYSLERELFPALVASNTLQAVALQTDFIDIGIPDDYWRFCRWIESGRRTALCT